LVELQRLGMRVTGLEVSEYARDNAHPEVKRHIHIWRGSSLPYSTGEFDFVLCKEALPHMDQPALMIEQIARVGKQAFLEIQVAETPLQAWLMRRWDPTHRFCQPRWWWGAVLDGTGYTGAVNYKRLF
jgi:2-polyprenyl-3-methyl-5-hydroxy-6-metoxy-1,4-benzoquinol methylase